jgi:hypothetical protein
LRPCLLVFPWNSFPLLKLVYIFGSLGLGSKHARRLAMPPVRPLEVPALLLRRSSESRPLAVGPDDYDVVGKDAEVIGRIVRTASGPAGKPWMWSITTRQDSVGPVLGYEASREAAMEKFAKSWHRE